MNCAIVSNEMSNCFWSPFSWQSHSKFIHGKILIFRCQDESWSPTALPNMRIAKDITRVCPNDVPVSCHVRPTHGWFPQDSRPPGEFRKTRYKESLHRGWNLTVATFTAVKSGSTAVFNLRGFATMLNSDISHLGRDMISDLIKQQKKPGAKLIDDIWTSPFQW